MPTARFSRSVSAIDPHRALASFVHTTSISEATGSIGLLGLLGLWAAETLSRPPRRRHGRPSGGAVSSKLRGMKPPRLIGRALTAARIAAETRGPSAAI